MLPPSEVRNFSKKRHGEGEIVLDKDRLERALAEERKRKVEEEEDQVGGWSQKKAKGHKYNNTSDSKSGTGEVTEEELEAYRLTKAHAADDPMAQMKGGEDELLPL